MDEPQVEVQELIDRVVREEYPRILATVARSVGDLDLAEDAVQDAIGSAIATWTRSGPPAVPGAWLTTAARNRAIDVLRREGRRVEVETRGTWGAAAPGRTDEVEPEADTETHVGPMVDDQLRLMFVTCHPSLTRETRVTLTLKYVCGLRTDEIARLLLVGEDTVTKRIRRARRKIREARILLRVPPPDRLGERVRSVLDCLYLVFTEGYAATGGDRLIRADLCAEAIRLTRLVVVLDPDNPEPRALLALELLQDSRAEARLDADGRPVVLADQDRSRWDRTEIAEALALIASVRESSDRSAATEVYLLQADVAAAHALAPSWERTDWSAIRAAYDELYERTGSPVVGLNRVVATSMADGPAAALRRFQQLGPDDAVARTHQWHLVHADLLERLGDRTAAAEAYRRALDASMNEPERAHVVGRLALVDRPGAREGRPIS